MNLSVYLRKRLSPAFTLDVRFTTEAGITILFGASGSGKTTVLRCLAGLAQPDAGRIAFGERVVYDSGAHIDVPVQQRRIGFVFQQLALFPHLSLARNIEYGIAHLPAPERAERVGRIADSFAIQGLLDRRPDQVSGGERQRTALARALVSEPELLLLDEPLSALDQRIRMRIIDDLRRWNDAHGIPMIYVTHSHHETFALGDHLVLLENGEVAAEGAPSAVVEQPARAVAASLAGFENILSAAVAAIDPPGGTMQCRIADTAVLLEVPLERATIGDAVSIGIRAGDVLVAREHPQSISARNILPARLLGATRLGPTIVATFDAGWPLVAHLTPASFAGLGLGEGATAFLVIKTYSCRVLSR